MIPIDTLLAWGATYKKVKAGEIIFQEGGICGFYYELIEGRVRWTNVDETGKEYLQNMVDPGECFGELPLFDGGVYAASAIAERDSLILRLNKQTFRELLKQDPELHFTFSRLLVSRVRFKFYMLKEIVQHEPEKRIQALLHYLKETQHNICPKCNMVKLTRQQIADMTGLRVETVIRAMRLMHEKGEINIDKGKVYYGDMRAVIVSRCSA
jgi:CRP-like cAMP-binding protein